MSERNTTPTTPPPPMREAATELLEQADKLRVIAARILCRAGELIEVAEEMRRAS